MLYKLGLVITWTATILRKPSIHKAWAQTSNAYFQGKYLYFTSQ